MCTIITVNRNSPALEARIRADGQFNNDGWSLLLVQANGKHTFLRTLDLEMIVNAVNGTTWARLFLHSRAATQGARRLENCHGWNARGAFYFHNGVLRNPEARNYAVDSQLIGKWINKHGVEGSLNMIHTESFANVMLADIQAGKYFVYHSTGGSLHMDNEGNFSTNSFGDLKRPCKPGHYYPNDLPIDRAPVVAVNKYADEYATYYRGPKKSWLDRGADAITQATKKHLPAGDTPNAQATGTDAPTAKDWKGSSTITPEEMRKWIVSPYGGYDAD